MRRTTVQVSAEDHDMLLRIKNAEGHKSLAATVAHVLGFCFAQKLSERGTPYPDVPNPPPAAGWGPARTAVSQRGLGRGWAWRWVWLAGP